MMHHVCRNSVFANSLWLGFGANSQIVLTNRTTPITPSLQKHSNTRFRGLTMDPPASAVSLNAPFSPSTCVLIPVITLPLILRNLASWQDGANILLMGKPPVSMRLEFEKLSVFKLPSTALVCIFPYLGSAGNMTNHGCPASCNPPTDLTTFTLR